MKNVRFLLVLFGNIGGGGDGFVVGVEGCGDIGEFGFFVCGSGVAEEAALAWASEMLVTVGAG